MAAVLPAPSPAPSLLPPPPPPMDYCYTPGSPPRHRPPLPLLILLFLLPSFSLSFALLASSPSLFSRANLLGRRCFPPLPRPPSNSSSSPPPRFAMITCSDGGHRIPGRSFDGLMHLVSPNKLRYVQRHGYDYIDASHLLDPTRPPSWSKILAVRQYLPDFDWVFWNDVDSLVTNPGISLSDIVQSVVESEDVHDMPDLIVTKDITGVNAGMFFFRNSEWSLQFLEKWWNQTSFIRPFGEMKSGDNDALKYLIQTMPEEEFRQHVRIPEMQCAFNSYLWRPSLKNSHRLMILPRTVWQGVYAEGDFMVHLAGVNDKKTWIKRILDDLHQNDIY